MAKPAIEANSFNQAAENNPGLKALACVRNRFEFLHNLGPLVEERRFKHVEFAHPTNKVMIMGYYAKPDQLHRVPLIAVAGGDRLMPDRFRVFTGLAGITGIETEPDRVFEGFDLWKEDFMQLDCSKRMTLRAVDDFYMKHMMHHLLQCAAEVKLTPHF